MIDMGILSVDIFDNWLNEEKEYLLGLKTEPEAETFQMEYYQSLLTSMPASESSLILHIYTSDTKQGYIGSSNNHLCKCCSRNTRLHMHY
jgi:hypothetical protein